jgi:diguanylate cyclase (GGDEF)-like protein
MTFIGPTSADFSKLTSEPHRLAMVRENSPAGLVYLQNELIGWQFYQHENIYECLEAVKHGKADYALIDTLILQMDRTLLMYPTLMAVPTSYLEIPVCLVINKDLPPLLKTALNKTILRITVGQVNQLVRSKSLESRPSFSLLYLFTHYPLQSGFSVGVLLLLLTTLFFSIQHNRQEKRQRQILTQANKEMEATLQELRKTEKSRDAYKEQAETDALTGVLNKAAVEKYVKKNLAALSTQEKVSEAFIIIDLDHFKEANDTQGHQYGDDILKDFAHALIRLTRHRDIVGRFGGDEFVLYLRNIPESALHDFAQRLLTAAHALDPVQRPPLSASIGIALINHAGLTYDEIFYMADKALYTVKEGGRDGYKIYGQ